MWMMLAACAPIGDSALQLREATDRFLLGDSALADALFNDADSDIVAVIAERDRAGLDVESYLTLLEEDSEDPPEWVQTEDDCEAYISELTDSVAGYVETVGTVPHMEFSEGTAPNCRMRPAGGECGTDDLMMSVFMGFTDSPADLDDYLDNYIAYHHPSQVAVALLEAPVVRAYQYAWSDSPDDCHQFNLYLCLPWQLTRHESSLRLRHDQRGQ